MTTENTQQYWSECHKRGIVIIPELMCSGSRIRLDVEFRTDVDNPIRHRYTKTEGKILYPNQPSTWSNKVHEFYEYLYNKEIKKDE